MTDYFKNIDQQVEILKKRNLTIKDENFTKTQLLRYNYYKLINGTYKYFSKNDLENTENKDLYRDGVEFNDLLDVHNFDKEIKKILLSAMLEIERISRSIISYKFMEKFPKPGAYLDPENYPKEKGSFVFVNIDSLRETIDLYKEEQNYNRSMKYYLDKYNSIPFWFIVNFISFGKLLNLYEIMDYKLREDIADEFQKFVEENLENKIDKFLTPSQLQSFLQNAKEIRNISAHDNLILDYSFETIEYFDPIHKKFGIKETDKRNTLFDTFIILQALLPREYFVETKNGIEKNIEELRKKIDNVAFRKIMNSIGYDKFF